MPSRFVEISTPIEDSVVWASFAGSAFSSFLESAVVSLPRSVVGQAWEKWNDTFASIDELDAFRDFRGALSGVPLPHGVAAYMLFAALATALVRIVIVRSKTHAILKTYGRGRFGCKEL